MFDDTVTLFCRFGPARAEAFQPAVLRGVRIDGAAGANSRAGYAGSADRALLFIPFSAAEGYVPPEEWARLDADGRAGRWTLQTGDVFAAGEHAGCAESLAARLGKGGAWYVVTTVDEKRADSPLAHFAVGGGRTYRYGGGVS